VAFRLLLMNPGWIPFATRAVGRHTSFPTAAAFTAGVFQVQRAGAVPASRMADDGLTRHAGRESLPDRAGPYAFMIVCGQSASEDFQEQTG
jgi:hypothetical protein